MKIIRNIIIAGTLSLSLLSCERVEPDNEVNPSSRPIRFSAEQYWPDLTKAADFEDLKKQGFQVWGAWKKDPMDNSSFYDDYKDGINNSVFSATPVSFIDDGWSYVTYTEYEREWYRGYYSFAALPESAFVGLVRTATHSASVSITDDIPTFTNQLRLNFQQDLDLSVSQENADFLCAFDCKDNSANNVEVVNLDFKHAFARFGLEFFVYDPLKMPVVTEVKIYGNRKSISTDETFILTHTKVGDGSTFSAQFDGVRATEGDPYYHQEFDPSLFEIGRTDSAVLCEKLMVFPENLTEDQPLYIDITYYKILENQGEIDDPYIRYYINFEENHTYTIQIKDVIWEPGETYIYKFAVDGLTDTEE